jgi:hypothetical protein
MGRLQGVWDTKGPTWRLCRADELPLVSINMSDWIAAEAATNPSRRAESPLSLQCTDTRTETRTHHSRDVQRPQGMHSTNGDKTQCRRLAAEQFDTINVNVWTTLSSVVTPMYVWSNISSPDARLWNATSEWGYPMNLTFINATSYQVHPSYDPSCSQRLLHSTLTRLLSVFELRTGTSTAFICTCCRGLRVHARI